MSRLAAPFVLAVGARDRIVTVAIGLILVGAVLGILYLGARHERGRGTRAPDDGDRR